MSPLLIASIALLVLVIIVFAGAAYKRRLQRLDGDDTC